MGVFLHRQLFKQRARLQLEAQYTQEKRCMSIVAKESINVINAVESFAEHLVQTCVAPAVANVII